jgi:regulator of RNase E activity RraA
MTEEHIQLLRDFDTCVIADAIDSLGVRLRNEGIATGGFRCLFKSLPPMVGYAATCTVRSADPPMLGCRYVERIDWWQHISRTPAPTVVVMQDIDDRPGTGAFFDKVHASVFEALGCVGAITNGAARELPGTEANGFQVFAGRIAISRAYIHIVEFGKPVEVGGLTIHPGDLIHGDRHGIVTIPQELELKLPAVARVIREKKQQLIALSRKPGTTHDELSRGLRDLLDFNPNSIRD